MSSVQFGSYTILGEIGSGPVGRVVGVKDTQGRTLALKLLPRQMLNLPGFIDRFRQRGELVTSLNHAALVPLVDFGEERGFPYLAMTYMPGKSLAAKLANGPLRLIDALNVVARTAQALDAAHAGGIAHGNLKPHNILFDTNGRSHLADFANVTLPDVRAALPDASLLDRLAYLAPEQFGSGSQPDAVADGYALGVLVYHMLAGHLPFEAPGARQMVDMQRDAIAPPLNVAQPNVPQAIADLVSRAMEKDPARRFDSPGDFARALAAARPKTKAAPAAPQSDPEEEIPFIQALSSQLAIAWAEKSLAGGFVVGALSLALVGLCGFLLLGGFAAGIGSTAGAEPLTQPHVMSKSEMTIFLPDGWAFINQAEGSRDAAVMTDSVSDLESLSFGLDDGNVQPNSPAVIILTESTENAPVAGPLPLLLLFLEDIPAPDGQTYEFDEPRIITLQGQLAAVTNLSGSNAATGNQMRGQVVAVTYGERIAFIAGIAPDSQWTDFAPTFALIIQSLQFSTFEIPSGGDLVIPEGQWAINESGNFPDNGRVSGNVPSGPYVDEWRFRGSAGQEVTFRMVTRTAGADMGLALYDEANNQVQMVFVEGEHGTNFTLSAALPADGVYTLVVGSPTETGGAYEVTLAAQ